MRDMDGLFAALGRSSFRCRFRLGGAEREYLSAKSMEVVSGHAREFVSSRLGGKHPKNDGRQTPMRGHPVFVAQHAVGACCRKCLEKWHGIERGRELSEAEIEYIVLVICEWLRRQAGQTDCLGTAAGDMQERLLFETGCRRE
jgi:hypothetical protein